MEHSACSDKSLLASFRDFIECGEKEKASDILSKATELQYPSAILQYMADRLKHQARHQNPGLIASTKGADPKTKDIDDKCPTYDFHPHSRLLQDNSGVPWIQVETAQDRYVPIAKYTSLNSAIKTIAFYLPQYHPFPENDLWWGKGFTEWSNVGKSMPLFNGHYQPHCPIHLGYYDLRIKENMVEQAALAKNYGIHGFCYYFYWFNGKTLMETPLLNMLSDPEVDIPFCLAWANENWTRRWDGQENDVLIAQSHSLEDSRLFMLHIKKYMLDGRYILHNNKPVLLVYRADIIPGIQAITDLWRSMAIEMGFQGLYLVACQTFGITDPTSMGFDAAVEFPPHGVGSADISDSLANLDPGFSGHVYDYIQVTGNKMNEGCVSYRKHYTCMLGWDNTARKGLSSHVFFRFSLAKYQDWLQANICKTVQQFRHSEDYPLLTFVNAWNEWAEGTHLEPDRKYGYGYLEATRTILANSEVTEAALHLILNQKDPRKYPATKKRNCAIIHVYYIDVFEEIYEYLRPYASELDIYASVTSGNHLSAIKAIDPNIIVDLVPNIGRDIGPFVLTLRSFSLAGLKYEACLKLHTKKSVYRHDGKHLRRSLLEGLCSRHTFDLALTSLHYDNSVGDIGMICPSDFLIDHKDANGYRLKHHHTSIEELSGKMGIEFHMSAFPAGSMFWFCQSALARLLRIELSDFAPEIGLSDGTSAHTIERLLAVLVQFSGLKVHPI